MNKPTDAALLVPVSDRSQVERNRIKDRIMAQIATQFIGYSSQRNLNILSSTEDYRVAWNRYGLANTGNYVKEDIIMVSGSGPWRGVTQGEIEAVFQQKYTPLLDKAINNTSRFVVGNAKGTDQLVQAYLKGTGYTLKIQSSNYCKCWIAW